MIKGGDAGQLMESLSLRQLRDEGELEKLVASVLEAHPEEVARFRSGERKLQGFFVGQVMRASKGKADPKLVGELLGKAL